MKTLTGLGLFIILSLIVCIGITMVLPVPIETYSEYEIDSLIVRMNGSTDLQGDAWLDQLEHEQILVVSVDANPSTGFLWEVVEIDNSILSQVENAEFQQTSTLMGAIGTQTFRFAAVGAGVTTIKLVYHRPFETNVDPLNTFSVDLIVR